MILTISKICFLQAIEVNEPTQFFGRRLNGFGLDCYFNHYFLWFERIFETIRNISFVDMGEILLETYRKTIPSPKLNCFWLQHISFNTLCNKKLKLII